MKTKRRMNTFLATVMALTLTGLTTVQAEDLSYTDLVSRITALETGLQSQQVQLASCDSCCTGEPSCGCAACCTKPCCDPSAWFVGYELTVLQPYVSEFGAGQAFDDEFGFGHRLTAGYDGGTGMGARARFWFYNHGHDFVPAGTGSLGIDMDVFDVELMLYEQLRNWNLMVTGGARYGRVQLNGDFFPTGNRVFFEGVGPTASLETTRNFGDKGLYFVGNARASILFGDIHVTGLPKTEDDSTVVFENQLGMGMTRDLGRATLNLRSVWETQIWMNDTLSNGTPGSNLGFGGPSSSVELQF